MSDGMSDARRDAEASTAIEVATERLVEAIRDVYDPMFGHNGGAIRYINRRLSRIGLKLVEENSR